MKILAVDTATTSCSVAVADDEDLLSEMTIDNDQTHSKHLTVLIQEVIRLAGISLSEIDGFAVTKGPGSFTGLRIGMSTVKGLAVASGRPVVGVSTLETLAMQSGSPDLLVCPLIDARRGEVYFAGYRFEQDRLFEQHEPQAVLPQKILSELQQLSVFIGNGAILYRQNIIDNLGDQAYFAPSGQHIIRAATVAMLGHKRFADGDVDEIESLVPMYLRKSDAELNRQKKFKDNA